MAQVMYATGRRKNSTARVWLVTGNGDFLVNKEELKKYFERGSHVDHILQPLEVTTSTGKYNVKAMVKGGGKTGQAGAIRLGIARCLAHADESMKSVLSKGGFLERDARMVERKKYGKRKARRSYQFSKR